MQRMRLLALIAAGAGARVFRAAFLSVSAAAPSVVAALSALSAVAILAASVTAQPALPPEQEAEVAALTHLLIAPCCWTASVADHGSGMAPVLEGEIREMVAQGMSQQAILDHYVAKYGERILVEPERKGFNQLAYWVPWVAIVFGLGIILAWFLRRRDHEPAPETVLANVAGDTDPYRRKVHEELERLDG